MIIIVIVRSCASGAVSVSVSVEEEYGATVLIIVAVTVPETVNFGLHVINRAPIVKCPRSSSIIPPYASAVAEVDCSVMVPE